MRYEFDTDIAKGLTVAELMQEETILCEIFEHIRLLRRKKEASEALEVAGRSEVARKRERGKKGLWVDKGVAARRLG